MKIAVLSGKGGAGKTFVAVNLAAAAGNATYIDCDVEEPNGRLFFRPENVTEETVSARQPVFSRELCSGCRKCIDFCEFNALAFVKHAPMVFPEICHACGGCAIVCPEGAVTEISREVGKVEQGTHGATHVVTGELKLGEASGAPVISRALHLGIARGGLTVIDCPPGSACPVVESVTEADYCVLVAEPTAFGFHNFKMVHELAAVLGKPCGVVINKMTEPYAPLEAFCREHGLPVLLRMPYSEETAKLGAEGRILCEEKPETVPVFARMLREIGGACA